MMQASTGDWFWSSSNLTGWAFNINARSWTRW
jgi:hypothetical protein